MKKIAIVGGGDITGIAAARIFAQTGIAVEVISADMAQEQQETKRVLQKIYLEPPVKFLEPPVKFDLPFEQPISRKQRRALERKRKKS